MKITAVEVFLLYDRFVYLKVETDEGISGWGEATLHGGKITAQIAEALGQKVVGRILGKYLTNKLLNLFQQDIVRNRHDNEVRCPRLKTQMNNFF